ncbi:hypothetical protein EVAR_31699_1 [Eumeta japonica]|uniref:Uncharacterized protein n=1 Tax=Eumeta variegata TaxID=151549 RepID=A0A4C1VS21_EUMVA|nr:hypothetical protein EVAR_31699_1 [Eumeta japonica]
MPKSGPRSISEPGSELGSRERMGAKWNGDIKKQAIHTTPMWPKPQAKDSNAPMTYDTLTVQRCEVTVSAVTFDPMSECYSGSLYPPIYHDLRPSAPTLSP